MNMPTPIDKMGIRRFLSAVNYLKKFCPDTEQRQVPPPKPYEGRHTLLVVRLAPTGIWQN